MYLDALFKKHFVIVRCLDENYSFKILISVILPSHVHSIIQCT